MKFTCQSQPPKSGKPTGAGDSSGMKGVPVGFPDLGGCDWHVNFTFQAQNQDPSQSVTFATNDASFVPYLGSISPHNGGDFHAGDIIGSLGWISAPSDNSQLNVWTIPKYGSSLPDVTHLAPAVFPPGLGR